MFSFLVVFKGNIKETTKQHTHKIATAIKIIIIRTRNSGFACSFNSSVPSGRRFTCRLPWGLIWFLLVIWGSAAQKVDQTSWGSQVYPVFPGINQTILFEKIIWQRSGPEFEQSRKGWYREEVGKKKKRKQEENKKQPSSPPPKKSRKRINKSIPTYTCIFAYVLAMEEVR